MRGEKAKNSRDKRELVEREKKNSVSRSSNRGGRGGGTTYFKGFLWGGSTKKKGATARPVSQPSNNLQAATKNVFPPTRAPDPWK